MHKCVNVCMYGYLNEHKHINILLYKFTNPLMYSSTYILSCIYMLNKEYIHQYLHILFNKYTSFKLIYNTNTSEISKMFFTIENLIEIPIL